MSAEQFVKEIKEKENNNGASPLCYDRLIYLMEAYKESELNKLQHHRATTVGLWATDRLDLIKDPENIMFKITDW